jgi:hypothetical protein
MNRNDIIGFNTWSAGLITITIMVIALLIGSFALSDFINNNYMDNHNPLTCEQIIQKIKGENFGAYDQYLPTLFIQKECYKK